VRVNVTGIAVAGTLGTRGGAGFLVPPPKKNMTPFSATSSCPLGNLITVADSDICFLLGGYVDWRKISRTSSHVRSEVKVKVIFRRVQGY